MKQAITIAVMLIICGLANNYSDNPELLEPATIVVDAPYYVQNEVLLPEYACTDTLVVKDAIRLNKAMALIDQGLIQATDDQIDSVLHMHCVVYNP